MVPNEEQKKIIDEIDNLTPWDRVDLIAMLLERSENQNIVEEYLDVLGYVDPDSYDWLTHKLTYEHYFEALGKMSDNFILDYVKKGELMDEFMSSLTADEISESYITDIDKCFTLLDRIFKGHGDMVMKWLRYRMDKND